MALLMPVAVAVGNKATVRPQPPAVVAVVVLVVGRIRLVIWCRHNQEVERMGWVEVGEVRLLLIQVAFLPLEQAVPELLLLPLKCPISIKPLGTI
jgi:hypothetical protein